MKYCPNCGAELVPGAKFCANCGAVVGAVTAPPNPRRPRNRVNHNPRPHQPNRRRHSRQPRCHRRPRLGWR
ncbi:zinc-ribbon domain-containing protein, partial [Lacticaseibacillus nasuensis]|uniref:zinc-ribbon domain-containing protein n=1 Tax=Lacticaseibacillus nasuensis TaxID=944671 RepID=UPI0015856272